MQNRFVKKTDQGVALVISVLLTFVFASIAIAVTNFSEQGYQLVQSSRESTYALYAADSGVECALYYDLNQNVFFESKGSNTGVNCGDNAVNAIYHSGPSPVATNCPRLGSGYDWCYKFVNNNIDNGAFNRNYRADVQFGVDEDDGAGNTVVKIVSQGYNSSESKRQQQREIVYEYSFR